MSKMHWWNDTDWDKAKNPGGGPCPTATLYVTNLTSNDLGSNPGLRVMKKMTIRLSHGTARQTSVKARWVLSNASWFPKQHWKTNINLKCTSRQTAYRTVNTQHLGYKTTPFNTTDKTLQYNYSFTVTHLRFSMLAARHSGMASFK